MSRLVPVVELLAPGFKESIVACWIVNGRELPSISERSPLFVLPDPEFVSTYPNGIGLLEIDGVHPEF